MYNSDENKIGEVIGDSMKVTQYSKYEKRELLRKELEMDTVYEQVMPLKLESLPKRII